MSQKILKEYIEKLVELEFMRTAGLKRMWTKFFDSLGRDPEFHSMRHRRFLRSLEDLDDDSKREVFKKYRVALKKTSGDKEKARELLIKSLENKDDSLNETIGDFSMSGLRRMEAPGNFRAGKQVTGSRSSLQNDIEMDKQDTNDAAVVLVKNGDNYLAVSRQDEFDNLNMPGGHIEVGEAPIDAAAREVHEETGLNVSDLQPLFVDDLGGKKVHVFKAGNFSGNLCSSHEGLASWEPEENMMKGQYCDTFKRAMKICR